VNINRWITFRTKVAYFFLPDILLLFITGRHICFFCFMPWYNWTIVESAVKHHNSLSLWIMLPSIQWVNQYKLYKNSYSHTNAPNLHDITEILLKMALNTITPTLFIITILFLRFSTSDNLLILKICKFSKSPTIKFLRPPICKFLKS
jgi:hypothetical protein